MARTSVKYCQDCKDRKVGCHSKCFAYNVEIARIKIAKKKLRDRKRADYEFDSYDIEKSKRLTEEARRKDRRTRC